jgi:hypothetical protein
MNTSRDALGLASTPAHPRVPAFMSKAYGVKVRPAGRPVHGDETYRTKKGDLITASQQGACGTVYWRSSVTQCSPGKSPSSSFVAGL